VREGDVLASKYRVERVLGMGGMGVVVAAHHIQLDQKVALKFLLPDALSNSEAVARFAREARAAVRIRSEHVARVIDVGTLPNGAPYMVMEYLDGGDLAAWLKERGPVPVEQAVEFVLQASEAVAEAHALGIIHRDLKPANLFCIRRADGRLAIKVLDFGISKMTQFGASGPGAMTHASALMGSPLYMSPEQMRSAKSVNSQTDIWALGIILFELLTGKPPFLAESLPELAYNVGANPPPSLRGIRPAIPAGLETVILRCLEKDRSHRFRNVAELALALFPFAPKRAKASVERISGIIQAAGLSQSALELPPTPQVEATQKSESTFKPVGQTMPGSKRSWGAVLWPALVGALVVVGGVTFALSGRFASKPSPAPMSSPPVPVEVPTGAVAPSGAVATAAAPPADVPQLAGAQASTRDAATQTVATTTAIPIGEPPKTRNSSRPAPAGPAMGAAATPKPSAGPNCTVVTDYDSEGQPHFKKVCK
jgi:serine/threonine-protein kinase